ncbi:MAG: RNA polymerase sigma factor RpoD/SigA [Polyangiaceae bacterium]
MPRTPKSPEPSKRPAKRPNRAAGADAPASNAAKRPRGAKVQSGETEPDADEATDEAHEREKGEEEEGEREAEDTEAAPESEPALSAVDPDEAETTDEVEPAEDAPVVSESPGSLTRFDPMQAYLREVQRHPLLTPEQTHELAVRFVKTQDPAAAAQLVTSNLRLVVKIAYEYRRAYKNIMDLVQEGNIGLMQAVKRYDPYRGVKLSSYAAWWIRAYILRFILNNWRLVKLGTTQAQRKLFFNLRKKRAELVAMGIDPTNAEIAKQLNVPETDVADMDVRLQQSEKSLDAPVGDAEGRSISRVDAMPSVWAGPEALVADEELQALLKEKLGEFRKTLVGKDKELAIFDERLVAEDPLTLQELGDRFAISRERVRQLEQRLTTRLREYLQGEMGDAAEAS